MTAKRLFLLCGLLVVLAFGSLAAGWHGSANVNAGTSLSSNSVQFCGSATGGWAIGGIVGLLAGIVVFVIALFRSITDVAKR